MFDWGAQAVTSILNSGLYEALEKIQKRPWLYDGLDKWLDKLEVRPANLDINIVYQGEGQR